MTGATTRSGHRKRGCRLAMLWCLVGGVMGSSGSASAQALEAEGATPSTIEAQAVWVDTLSPAAEAVLPLLSTRHSAAPCDAVEAHFASSPEDALAVLLEIAEEVEHPPPAPIHAVTCLLRNASVSDDVQMIEPVLLQWVSQRESMGLGLLVLSHLDTLEPELAERLAEAALRGDFARRAEARIVRSDLLRTALR